jgi:DNA (cytosine-5)-methyltransferase 1
METERSGALNELALFAGAGGGILGGHLLGWRTVCAVEWDPYAACVLAARQNDGLLPPFPIWDDIQTFEGRPWRGIVDVVSGGFPCQDISIAGKGDGLDGERSGLWREMARVVGEVRPRYVYIENSPMLTTRGGTRVIADLTALGYDCRWTVMGAADVGANHKRDRIWILAFANSMRELQQTRSKRNERDGVSDSSETMADAKRRKPKMGWDDAGMGWLKKLGSQGNAGASWWASEPDVGRVANGVAARVDRLKAIGNGQVPAVAATAWRLLNDHPTNQRQCP